MKFGALPVAEAEGAILAHSLVLPGPGRGTTLKKGRRLSAEDVAALTAAGHESVTAARLDPDDVHEDEAAVLLARALAGDGLAIGTPFTGRANLFAERRGVAVIDRDRLDRINLIDEALTLASIAPYAVVDEKQMVATVKIIPFSVKRAVVESAIAIAREDGPLVRVAGFVPHKAALIQTTLPGLKASVLDKTVAIIRGRVEALGGQFLGETRCGHEARAVADAIGRVRAEGATLILIAGASAITDRRDVIPEGITEAGGAIDHFGMPVDPGNLLLLAHLGRVPVLGLPGCVRSPKFNGFDWVLQRLSAGIAVTGRDLMLMGSGGLLTEIPSRPMPRAGAAPGTAPHAPRIAAIVLAAGQSRRMGKLNKLLADVDGVPMLLRAVDSALASHASPVIVVTGHEDARVRDALGRKRKITVVHNPDYAQGLSTSLARGLAAVPESADGALVCLGDMPRIKAQHLDRLIDAFNPVEGRAICVPTYEGKRGNPVLFARRFFREMATIAGDVGARHLIGEHGELVAEVEIGDEGVLIDVDSPDALVALKAKMGRTPS
ncbi:MAG: molybdopterin-binding/glycosyltransferase family 2 protein [Alphaproteobacteria bacterium]